jgi:NAD(P)-dependent dehydrogenase (short-subunit alcohol dehydrogenase family)
MKSGGGPMGLEPRSAIVTGPTHGIGKAIAIALAN